MISNNNPININTFIEIYHPLSVFIHISYIFMYKLVSFFNKFAATSKMQIFVPSYLKNSYLFQLETTVAAINEGMVEFTDTIFHPQGGGQPDDKGSIIIGDQQITIISSISQRQTGRIMYKLQNTQKLQLGAKVLMKIDKDVRIKHVKLHSAGHIIDLAVQKLKYQWQAAKGYHFEDSPYVEYKAKHENLEEAKKQIQIEVNKLLKEDIPVVKQVYSYGEAVQKGIIAEEFKASLIRIIKYGDSSCPCGGTHVENVKQLEKLDITKLQKKGKNLRVFYEI